MIDADQLFKRYGDVEAVAGVSLRVHEGELFGLIGHNGAGKSTLFKMMLGLEAPSGGQVRIDGRDVRGAAFREVRRHLGYLPENVVLYDNLTGLETLQFFAKLKRADASACGAVLERVGLSHAADRRVRGYSKGMRQRLGFAQALLGHPTLLFLDEPTNGLDPQGIRDFYRTLSELQGEGVTIVLTSHILSEIQERVGRLAVMKNGRVHAEGTVQAMREAMGLPLRFELRLEAGAAEPVRQALQPLATELRLTEGGAALECARQHKMAALQAIAMLGARIVDVQVHEPSLEDVLLGQGSTTT
jgi:Cu-processing system ATP-binding protein